METLFRFGTPEQAGLEVLMDFGAEVALVNEFVTVTVMECGTAAGDSVRVGLIVLVWAA